MTEGCTIGQRAVTDCNWCREPVSLKDAHNTNGTNGTWLQDAAATGTLWRVLRAAIVQFKTGRDSLVKGTLDVLLRQRRALQVARSLALGRQLVPVGLCQRFLPLRL